MCNNWFTDLVVLHTTCVVTICEGIFEERVEVTHNCVLSQLFCTRHITGCIGDEFYIHMYMYISSWKTVHVHANVNMKISDMMT